ncbi:hypothetical protein MCUN1_001860 [Malassezia cuniculi]|uniref:Uncharacterized protein n=1 Tax=Malassezia cuniculi TaxID=948313 RepID=A0AAF0EUZ9_9BASI|nr:hypothetical protein MCUN1_001860 [Malassezia cuniculi]
MTAAPTPVEEAQYGAQVEDEFAALTNRAQAQAQAQAQSQTQSQAQSQTQTHTQAHPQPDPLMLDDSQMSWSGRAHSRTPSGSVASMLGSEANTDITTPHNPAKSPSLKSPLPHERPSFLDMSALSPAEYAAYLPWVERIKPAHSRRKGLLDEHSAIKFLRSEFGINAEDEVKIMCLFERLPLGLMPGHFFAMVRLAAWAQQGSQPSRDLIFTQTAPPRTRRRKKNSEAASVTEQPLLSAPGSATQAQTQSSSSRSRGESNPRLVRPTPVVARPSRNILRGLADDAQLHLHAIEVPSAPPPVVEEMDLLRATHDQSPVRPTLLDRPSAPLPPQQVSPLIQASLNARSEVKKASRQALRPKTFTVLSSSSGQFDRAKARLLTGQEAPPEAQPAHGKRRTHSLSKNALDEGDAKFSPHTIAPKPSYLRKTSASLPAWLREQEEIGDKQGHELEGPSVLETLNNKAEQMDAGQKAAASIDRNTPFFPPHQRDLERATEELQGGSLARYRALNAQTSETSRSRLHSSKSKQALQRRRSEALQSQVQPWGTMLEAGTYAGFRPLTSRGDLRLLTPLKEQQAKREFQHHFPPGEPTHDHENHDEPHERPSSSARADGAVPETPRTDGARAYHERAESNENHDTSLTLEVSSVRRRSSKRSSEVLGPRMQPALPRPETQIFVLQEDVTRPQLPYLPSHERGHSGTWSEYGKDTTAAPAPRALTAAGTQPEQAAQHGQHHQHEQSNAESLASEDAEAAAAQSTDAQDIESQDSTVVINDDSSERLNHPLPPLPGA